MWRICKKEWFQFYSSLTGYIAVIIFLLFSGLLLFVVKDTSLLEFGYATLNGFFGLIPWLLLFFVPTITMKSIADELKTGTFELLSTLPLKVTEIVWGKFFGALAIVITALLPTVIYAVSLQQLSATGGIDVGATIGSYIGLFFLSALFTAIGIAASSFTSNTIVAFILAAFVGAFFFYGFEAISKLNMLGTTLNYYIETIGINFHYKSMSRGVIELADVTYIIVFIIITLFITQKNISK